MTRRADILVLAVSAAWMVGSCRQEPVDETAVARIEDRTLTMQDIRTQFDSTRPPTEAQIQQFLRRWIADELLYREAVRRGFDQTPTVQRRLEELRRQTVIQDLLQSEIYDAPAMAPDEADIQRYYEQNQESFVLAEQVVLVSFVVFGDRPKATEFRNAVLRGTPWSEAIQSPDHGGAIRGRTDSVYFTESRLLPRELWRVATTIAPRSPSFPVSTEDGFFVVNVWSVQRPGSPADLAYVRNEITNRLTVERRQRAYRSLVENLRSRYAVDIYLSPSFGDTTAITRLP